MLLRTHLFAARSALHRDFRTYCRLLHRRQRHCGGSREPALGVHKRISFSDTSLSPHPQNGLVISVTIETIRHTSMAVGENWSLAEVQATVIDYMAMSIFELSGQRYSKTDHRRALMQKLSGRSEAAIELKHQNISAVLRDLGYLWIPGYKPRSNYQTLLAEVVENWVRSHPEIDRFNAVAAEAPAATPEHFDFNNFETVSPTRQKTVGVESPPQSSYGPERKIRMKCDYAAREARNSSLGLAGEELVVRFEQHRLTQLGLDRLAGKVRNIAASEGDGAGFDVLSFDADGTERFVEVKTTAFARETPFYASSAEIRFSQKNAPQYSLYRLFDFRKSPRCFSLPGAIDDHVGLDAISYRCSFR